MIKAISPLWQDTVEALGISFCLIGMGFCDFSPECRQAAEKQKRPATDQRQTFLKNRQNVYEFGE